MAAFEAFPPITENKTAQLSAAATLNVRMLKCFPFSNLMNIGFRRPISLIGIYDRWVTRVARLPNADSLIPLQLPISPVMLVGVARDLSGDLERNALRSRRCS